MEIERGQAICLKDDKKIYEQITALIDHSDIVNYGFWYIQLLKDIHPNFHNFVYDYFTRW